MVPLLGGHGVPGPAQKPGTTSAGKSTIAAAEAAQSGRGRTDVMAGSLEVGVEVIDELSVAIGTLVQQAPKTADNRKFRFPFWDTTNGADNRQIFYLDITGTF